MIKHIKTKRTPMPFGGVSREIPRVRNVARAPAPAYLPAVAHRREIPCGRNETCVHNLPNTCLRSPKYLPARAYLPEVVRRKKRNGNKIVAVPFFDFSFFFTLCPFGSSRHSFGLIAQQPICLADYDDFAVCTQQASRAVFGFAKYYRVIKPTR